MCERDGTTIARGWVVKETNATPTRRGEELKEGKKGKEGKE